MLNSFKLEGEISKKNSLIISVIGATLLLFVWYFITKFDIVSKLIIPSPYNVLSSYLYLYTDQQLIYNSWFSIKLNLLGYLEAILISIPLGFLMGLVPFFRSLISKYFDALRFLPLPAISGIFVACFGIEIGMKVHFLSFGIMLYLIPVIVQRIDEVEIIHKQTIATLGASSCNKIRHLYFPYVMSKISDDIRVLVAISWTYIVIVELLNKEGGLGGLIFVCSKQSYVEGIYALVLLIIIFGYLQDLLFKETDKFVFPFKHDGQIKTNVFQKLKTIFIKK
jgi:NitT/TauT family transport system permease protein